MFIRKFNDDKFIFKSNTKLLYLYLEMNRLSF